MKTILSIIIVFSIVNLSNIFALDVNNNNNNNNQRPELPKEIWKSEIVKKFFYPIEKAETLLELKAAVKEFLKFSLLSKKYNKIAKEIINEKIVNGKKITLKELYDDKKNEIIGKIKKFLKEESPYRFFDSFEWFNTIDAVNKERNTALMIAIYSHHKEAIELLIQNGINVNARNNINWTPLITAVYYRNKEIVKLLLRNEADISAKIKYGNNALMLAAACNYKEIVKLLIEYGANLNILDDSGETPLMRATRNGYKKIVKHLIKYGADINVQNKYGNTALILAISKGRKSNERKDVAKLLIDNGADISIQNEDGETALTIVRSEGDEELVKLIEAKNKTNQIITNCEPEFDYCGKRHECIVQ